MNADLLALRAYVTERDGAPPTHAANMVLLSVSHANLTQRWPELRFELHATIRDVKERLYHHGGTPAAFQVLVLVRGDGSTTKLDDDARMLGFYSPRSGEEIRIIDTDPNSLSKSGWLEDTSKVDKYVMDEATYDARQGTVRKYKQMLREKGTEASSNPDFFAQIPDENLVVGARCEVHPGGRRGEIKYVGEDLEHVLGGGWWVGVHLDEPMGKNDGTVKGHVFFKCPPNYGVVVRPDKVVAGDFPVRGLDEDEDEM